MPSTESGPGQNLAFEDAVAHVGCPDRGIDRHALSALRRHETRC